MTIGHVLRRSLGLAAGLLLSTATAQADVVKHYVLDGVGNVRVVENQTGGVVERHDFLPFGEECQTGPCASNPDGPTPLRFTGKERDAETGLDYFGARYYAPRLARFTTVDPVYTWQENLVDPQRWNRYAYARNNPLRYLDPDGRSIWSKAIKFIIKGGDLAATTAGVVEDGGVFLSSNSQVGTGQRIVALGSLLSEVAPVSGRDIKEGAEFIGTLVKRGPKPKGVGPHNLTIDRRIEDLQAEGMEHLHGGSLTEEVVPTPGGLKSARRPDITMRRPDGTVHRENVGQARVSGEPIKREGEALGDLEKATGERPAFTPYNPKQ